MAEEKEQANNEGGYGPGKSLAIIAAITSAIIGALMLAKLLLL